MALYLIIWQNGKLILPMIWNKSIQYWDLQIKRLYDPRFKMCFDQFDWFDLSNMTFKYSISYLMNRWNCNMASHPWIYVWIRLSQGKPSLFRRNKFSYQWISRLKGQITFYFQLLGVLNQHQHCWSIHFVTNKGIATFPSKAIFCAFDATVLVFCVTKMAF